MLMGKHLAAIAAAAAMMAAPLSANATFFSNSVAFDAANPGLTPITFEGITDFFTDYDPSMTPGATISPTGQPIIVDSTTCGAPTDHFSKLELGAGATISFDPAVNAVGFDIALDGGFCGDVLVDGTATISLFSGTTLLDTQTITTAQLDTFTTFAGWSGLGTFDNLSIVLSATSDFLSLDNLRYGNVTAAVPEPGTLALIGLGLAGLAASRRRKS